jgi:hypothetical protein
LSNSEVQTKITLVRDEERHVHVWWALKEMRRISFHFNVLNQANVSNVDISPKKYVSVEILFTALNYTEEKRRKFKLLAPTFEDINLVEDAVWDNYNLV